MTNSLPLDGKSFKEKLEEILTMPIAISEIENIVKTTAIVSLLLESMPEWLPEQKSVKELFPEVKIEPTAEFAIYVEKKDSYNSAIRETEANFKEFIKI